MFFVLIMKMRVFIALLFVVLMPVLGAVSCGWLASLTQNQSQNVNHNEKISANGYETHFRHGVIPAQKSPVHEDVYWNIGTNPKSLLRKQPHIFVFFHGDNERTILYRVKFFYVKRKAQAARQAGVNAILVFPSSTQTVGYDYRWRNYTLNSFAQLIIMITQKVNSLQKTNYDPKKIPVHLMGFSGGYRPMPNIALNSELNIASLIFFDALYRHYHYAIDYAKTRQGNIILVSTRDEPAVNAHKVYRALKGYKKKIHISVPQMHHYLSAKRHLVPAMVLADQMTRR